MQKLADVCIRRPVFATMLILALVVVGTTGYFHLDVDRSPAVDVPTIYIRTMLPGASPVEMETLIAQPIERQVNTVEGIDELRSISSIGTTFIILQFDLKRNVTTAAEDVRTRVSDVLQELPEEAFPPSISKFDTDRSPSMTLALSGDRSVRELTELADKTVRVQLERSTGVGEVEIMGAEERAINIWIDADRLAAYQLSITAVRDAIARQNSNVPGGKVLSDLREQTLRTLGRITDARDFNDIVVAHVNGTPVRIRDIGRAEDGTKEVVTTSRLQGRRAVVLNVKRQSGANTVAVIEGIKKRLPQIAAQLPPDIKFEIIEDQSRYIYEALREIKVHLLLGSVLASLVVLLFMRSWRSMLIAGVAIPASVISTFGMMWALDFTLNSVTMLALVLMVGIVIDDAIVVLENIFRFIEEKRMTPMQAARDATAEIGLAVMATTLSLVVIFVPVSFMSSISGRFLFQFGITAAVAVLVSLLVSFTLTPMMSARFLSAKDAAAAGPAGGAAGHGRAAARSRRGFYAWIDRGYSLSLAWAMRHRFVVAVVATAVMATSIPLYQMVKQEFTPSDTDEGEFEVNITGPQGASVASMDQAMREIEASLAELPQIRVMLASSGSRGFGGANQGRIYLRLAPHAERVFTWGRLLSLNPLRAFKGNYSQRDVVGMVREKLKRFSGVRTSVRSNNSSISVGGPSYEIDFALLGPDLDQLAAYAERLRVRAPELGVIDADTTLRLDKPELRVEIDRKRAADLDVDTQDIAQALRIMVGGDERVSRFRDASVNDDYDVQLRLTDGHRNDANTISRLYVANRMGQLVRLDNLVQVVAGTTASRIDRLDRQRTVSLRGSIAPGFALADRLEALKGEVESMNLPAGYATRVGGRGRELERTFSEFLLAFALSVVFMYMILASQFESLVHPFTILLSLPLSLPFALFTLWATGNTLNLYSALGLLVLFGVVKKNAILQIDHINALRAKGMGRPEAILQGNRDRLRPILMTTLALVAGMLPLALGNGPGAEERRAVAVVVIGGQSLCLLLTLLVTPVAYSYLDDLGVKLRWRMRGLYAPQAATLHEEPASP